VRSVLFYFSFFILRFNSLLKREHFKGQSLRCFFLTGGSIQKFYFDDMNSFESIQQVRASIGQERNANHPI